MILVDSSVWIEYLRAGHKQLASMLENGIVTVHPFVIGELACGNLKNRAEVLALLGDLPSVPVATGREALQFIEARALMGRGVGYIDVHLLASAALAGDTRLWTLDRQLAAVAGELRLAFDQ